MHSFAQAKAKEVPQAEVCWRQRQWHSPEVAQPRALQPAARRLAVAVANSWAVGLAGAGVRGGLVVGVGVNGCME